MTDILNFYCWNKNLILVYWVELCPVKKISQKQGFYRYGQVNMKSSGWALTQYVWLMFHEKGKSEHWHAHAEGRDIFTMWRWKRRWKWCTYKSRKTKGCQKSTRNSVWNGFFLHGHQKEPALLTPWFGTSDLQICEKDHFCYLSYLVCVLCYGNPRKLIHG